MTRAQTYLVFLSKAANLFGFLVLVWIDWSGKEWNWMEGEIVNRYLSIGNTGLELLQVEQQP